ncbi:uncharacterized protein LOC108024942 [Drosophila biarmipes]|uniref:uncharacterized protein LOC108024942 n=1 Tax=Drosophila biarmipes TaxID=125945 RepID=UPI0007E62CC9|nr:uncharacterized protein LOC108024942 [Drosophila biarmipes]
MAKRFSLTEEKLNDLFVEEVASVVKLVGRLPAKDQIAPICTRWLNIFQQSTPRERFSRNYMLLLLHKQLNEQKTLAYPFTHSKTSQMDLPTIHQMSLKMDNKAEHQSGAIGDECKSSESLDEEELSSFSSCENLEQANLRLVDENTELSKELQELQSTFEKLQVKRDKSEKAIQMHCEQIHMLDKENRYLKRIFACSSIYALKQLCTGQDPGLFFDTLYNVLCEEESDYQQVKHFNEHFKALLNAHMEHFQRQQRAPLLEQVNKRYDKLRSKVSRRYKNVMAMKLDAQGQELTLSAMRYLTVLRRLFLETFEGKASTKKAVVKLLEQSYDQMSEML